MRALQECGSLRTYISLPNDNAIFQYRFRLMMNKMDSRTGLQEVRGDSSRDVTILAAVEVLRQQIQRSSIPSWGKLNGRFIW